MVVRGMLIKQQESAAVDALSGASPIIRFEPVGPEFVRNLVGREAAQIYLNRVVVFQPNLMVEDADMVLFRDLRWLETLNLSHHPISDSSLHHLTGLKNLKRLDLRNTKVTADGIRMLQKALPDCTIVR